MDFKNNDYSLSYEDGSQEQDDDLQDINEFKIDSMIDSKENGVKIIIIGKPGTGKSTLIKDIVYNYKHKIPVAQVYSGADDANSEYSSVFPESFIFDDYDETQLEMWIDRQKLALKNVNNPWSLVILDDCTDNPSQVGTPLMQSIFKKGRHWKQMFILSLQYCLDIKPALRSNVDYIFIFREMSTDNRKKLHKCYASQIQPYSYFCSVMDEVAKDHTCLVINNKTQSNELKDCIFYYQAKTHPSFKFGCKEYRKWHRKRYNKDSK